MLEYIKRIAVFIIMEGVLLGIVNNEDYKKFIKMCSGMIMIVIVLSPFDKVFGVTNIVYDFFNDITNENRMEELREVMANVTETEELDNLRRQYQEILRERIAPVAENNGYKIVEITVIFSENEKDYIGSIGVMLEELNRITEDGMVEKVDISLGDSEGTYGDNPGVMAIKNYIVDTYGINYERIKINILQ